MIVSPSQQTGYSYQVNKTTATLETSPYDTAESTDVQSDKLSQMIEKYKDVYTPIPETYSATDEKIQHQKINETYPDYISFPDFLKIVDSAYAELGGEPLKLGTKPTQEQIEKQKMASEIAYEKVGGEDRFIQMQRDVIQIKNDYPVNEWAKEGVSNAKEMTRFKNAAIYEGLEKGQTLTDATRNARSLMQKYMDYIPLQKFIDDRTGFTAYAEKAYAGPGSISYEPDPIEYGTHSSVWDLRNYGIEGRWQENDIYNNDNAMIAEIEKKISQFTFMVNNKALIEKEANTHDEYHRGPVDSYQKMIVNGHIPQAQMALDIFKNYQIYDSVNVKA